MRTLVLTDNSIGSRSTVEKLLNDNGFVVHNDEVNNWIISENEGSVQARLIFCEHEEDLTEQLFTITDNEIAYNQQTVDAVLTQDRKRIADELHDGLTGTLVALMMKVEKMKSLQTNAETAELCNQMQQMVRFMLMFELRQIINDEDPIALLNNTFQDAVCDLCKDANSCGTGMFTFAVQDEFPMLAPEIERSLFRIVQELITNAIKYAQADLINLTLQHGERFMNLLYRDNGIGMPFVPDQNNTPTIKRGRGIKNIVNRVEKLKGTIELLSAPNKGLTVSIHIPI